jgi:hypothetical protein
MTQRSSPLTRGGPVRRPDDFDELLTRFFRSEMPDPWPAVPEAPPAEPRRQAPARPWFRHSSRLALAAAVALFLIGYLTLASRFPAGNTNGGPSIRPELGNKDGIHHFPPKMDNRVDPSKLQGNAGIELLRPEVVPTPDGGAARSWGAQTQGPRRTIYLNVERIR